MIYECVHTPNVSVIVRTSSEEVRGSGASLVKKIIPTIEIKFEENEFGEYVFDTEKYTHEYMLSLAQIQEGVSMNKALKKEKTQKFLEYNSLINNFILRSEYYRNGHWVEYVPYSQKAKIRDKDMLINRFGLTEEEAEERLAHKYEEDVESSETQEDISPEVENFETIIPEISLSEQGTD